MASTSYAGIQPGGHIYSLVTYLVPDLEVANYSNCTFINLWSPSNHHILIYSTHTECSTASQK